jgi:catechol O-methyltransferase
MMSALPSTCRRPPEASHSLDGGEGNRRRRDGRPLRNILELGGKRLPFLRWSVLRMALGTRTLLRNWQVGDGREEALAEYVVANARRNDLDDVVRTIDEFCMNRSVMINVGDEKGEILDAAVRRASPQLLFELGTYCGYSALRMARVMAPGARLCSIEFSEANAAIARRIWDHAGIGDELRVVVGTLGDGGSTIHRLRTEQGFGEGMVDFVFVDHDKAAYLPDLERILGERWLHPGSIVVADNVKFPGAPEYRAYLKARQDSSWRTIEHETHVEYQSLLKDLVLESEYLGEQD